SNSAARMGVLGVGHHYHLERDHVRAEIVGTPGDRKLMARTVILRIERRETPQSNSRWEEFELTWKPGMNVISAMMEIAANPMVRSGQPTTPIAYDSNCLEEVCGSCAMLINGRARMACSALVDKLEQPITLEPLRKFPVVRDLQVDRG